jgi:hypothetical protein
MRNILTLLFISCSITFFAQDIPNARFPFDPARKPALRLVSGQTVPQKNEYKRDYAGYASPESHFTGGRLSNTFMLK